MNSGVSSSAWASASASASVLSLGKKSLELRWRMRHNHIVKAAIKKDACENSKRACYGARVVGT
jgi:hypothetical protein